MKQSRSAARLEKEFYNMFRLKICQFAPNTIVLNSYNRTVIVSMEFVLLCYLAVKLVQIGQVQLQTKNYVAVMILCN